MVQMPKGVPVATVGINEAENAALLACHILSLKYETLRETLKEYRRNMAEDVLRG
jgi:5-(carboxyamino)imidazole ribonucleotide mutase